MARQEMIAMYNIGYIYLIRLDVIKKIFLMVFLRENVKILLNKED